MTSFRESKISGGWIIDPIRHTDERGWFQELFKFSTIQEATNFSFHPTQINVSKSSLGVIRGIHYSIAPEGQAKYVSVLDGEIDDYIIDIRKGSPTFGQWERVRVSAELGNSVLLATNLAHAFQVVSSEATVCYAVTAEFNPAAEKAINPFCTSLNIDWAEAIASKISPKDRTAPTMLEQEELGNLPHI